MRNKWLILAIALASAVAGYFFVAMKQNSYKATAEVSTGIMDIISQGVQHDNPNLEEGFVEMGFSNLIEFLTSKGNISYLTYQLLLHDLAPDKLNDDRPFRSPKGYSNQREFVYDDQEVAALTRVLRKKLGELKDTFSNPEYDYLYKKYAEAYGYTFEKLIDVHLKVDRIGHSDLVAIEFSSENPKLSAFAVNALCNESLRHYNYIHQGQASPIANINDSHLDSKHRELDTLKFIWNDLLEKEKTVDLGKEKQSIYAKIQSLENKKYRLEQKIPEQEQKVNSHKEALEKASNDSNNDTELASIRRYAALQQRIRETEEEYKKTGEEKLKKVIALYNKQMEKQLGHLVNSDALVDEPKVSDNKENLQNIYLQEKQNYEKLTSAIEQVTSELVCLKATADSYSNSQSYLDRLETQISSLEKEYNELHEQYSQSPTTNEDLILPVSIFEYAEEPQIPEPKNKILVAGSTGLVGGTMASIIFLLIAFIDKTLSNPYRFSQLTGIKNVLGVINEIEVDALDWQQLFTLEDQDKRLPVFRESLRNLRFAIEQSGAKQFLFTSTQASQGKTFLMIALAHAFTVKNKRVLLVDTNFKNNTLTRITHSGNKTNEFPSRIIDESNLEQEFTSQKLDTHFDIRNIDIIGTRGSSLSPSEVFADKNLPEFLSKLSYNYDYVFLESASMSDHSDTKELSGYVDKVIAIFSADAKYNKDDKDAIAYLKKLGDKFVGAVLNRVDLKELDKHKFK